MKNELDYKRYKQTKELATFDLRVLNFKFQGATDFEGEVVVIKDRWFKKTVRISYDYRYNSAAQNAVDFLLRTGWDVAGVNKDQGIIVINGWDSRKQLVNIEEGE